MSLLELLDYLKQELCISIPLKWDQWRPGDQPCFVCDLTKAKELLGWAPQVGVREGVRDLAAWVAGNRDLFGWLR